MKKVLCLAITGLFLAGIYIISQSPVYAAKKQKYLPGHEQLPGYEAGLNEWLHVAPFNVKVLTYSYPETFRGKAVSSSTSYKEGHMLVNFELLFKNPQERPLRLYSIISYNFHLVDTRGKSSRPYGQLMAYQSYDGVRADVMPGEPLRAHIYFWIDQGTEPGKLLISSKTVKNAPVGRIIFKEIAYEDYEKQGAEPGSPPPPPEERPQSRGEKTIGDEAAESAEQAARDEIKRKAAEEARKGIKKLLKF